MASDSSCQRRLKACAFRTCLAGIYERVRAEEIRPGDDHVAQVARVDAAIVARDKPVGSSSFLGSAPCSPYTRGIHRRFEYAFVGEWGATRRDQLMDTVVRLGVESMPTLSFLTENRSILTACLVDMLACCESCLSTIIFT